MIIRIGNSFLLSLLYRAPISYFKDNVKSDTIFLPILLYQLYSHIKLHEFPSSYETNIKIRIECGFNLIYFLHFQSS